MTPVITLREPLVLPRRPLPLEDGDGNPFDWSMRQATGLRFERWRAERGDFDGDRFGLRPEPLPPIVREVVE